MRPVARLVLYLVLCVLLVSVASSYYQIEAQRHSLKKELQKRAELLGESLQQNLENLLATNANPEITRLVERLGNREHLAGIAVYDQQGTRLAVTPAIVSRLTETPASVSKAMAADGSREEMMRGRDGHRLYIYVLPLHQEAAVTASLMIVQEADQIRAQTAMAWRDVSLRMLLQMSLITVITVLIFQRSVTAPIARTVRWMKDMRNGRIPPDPVVGDSHMLSPLASEVKTFASSLVAARASAQQEASMREAAEAVWTAERLCVSLRRKLHGARLFIVSNREPYMHVRQGKQILPIVPASGLVTALEPILQACDGTWVAHGSGNADRETVDARNCLRVPPDNPLYTLRRVWLTNEEEHGYYQGFSNEGLWPLCHVAHTRPTFRGDDWQQYRQVNEKFADALLEEMAGVAEPVVVVQDYHFALLPRLLKQRRPDARVGLFWHIPWPNPEAFGICPWQRELLDGMLGADLLGFHIQGHCQNFLETVDRALESRIEWERFAVNRNGHVSEVRPFPISVVFPDVKPDGAGSAHADQAQLLEELGVESLYLGVGVDRVDYTKGIIERFLGIERFLEKYPQWQRKFTFAQIGAPSRTHIKRYHDFLAEVDAEAELINTRFQSGKWKPIILLKRHHSHEQVERYYRAADLCLVTSLHDGMNLVAKEYIAARHDDQGVLILSQFTGAARELPDALIVNPYHTEELADTLHTALEMDVHEQKLRMRRMRQQVKQQNVYRWAANLIGDLCEVRVAKTKAQTA